VAAPVFAAPLQVRVASQPAAIRHAEVMRVRKLLVPMFMAVVIVAPAASAAVGPLAPPPEIAEPGSSDDSSGPEARRKIQSEAHSQRRAAVRRAKRKAQPAFTVPPQLEAIAQCESGGDPRAIGGGGAYRGKYQFSYSTWAGVGGSGDPAAAPESEQDRRAAMLYARSGPGQWPVCGS
jgi:Transglycosylase-like domain